MIQFAMAVLILSSTFCFAEDKPYSYKDGDGNVYITNTENTIKQENGQAKSQENFLNSADSDYYKIVVSLIRKNWKNAKLKEKLETVVSIRISLDGNISVLGIEKSSGSKSFDKSVLNAISASSPLPAPPRVMEIGIRFYP